MKVQLTTARELVDFLKEKGVKFRQLEGGIVRTAPDEAVKTDYGLPCCPLAAAVSLLCPSTKVANSLALSQSNACYGMPRLEAEKIIFAADGQQFHYPDVLATREVLLELCVNE